MSGLKKGKHVVAEIDGVRCTIVEAGISNERMTFLQRILEGNKLEVKTKEDATVEGSEMTYTIGVTNLVFNPVIAMYARSLFLPNGTIVSPAFWNQETDHVDPRYWRFRKKIVNEQK